MTITMKPATEMRHDVFQGKRTIGFLLRMNLRGIDGWRFISNRADIFNKMPVPPLVYITPNDALASISFLIET